MHMPTSLTARSQRDVGYASSNAVIKLVFFQVFAAKKVV